MPAELKGPLACQLLRDKCGARRIMLAGHWRWEIYEAGLAAGFRANGWEVVPFRFTDYLLETPFERLQAKLKCGPAIARLNQALIESLSEQPVAALFLQKPDLILPSTIQRIKRMSPQVMVLSYHNDNPFIGLRDRIKWRHYLNALKRVDLAFVYRPSNVPDARQYGARQVSVLMPYYLTYRHRPYDVCAGQHDVVYVGHYEKDGRAELIDYLVQHSVSVGVYGTGWEEVADDYPWIPVDGVRPLRGDEYSRVISAAKIALVLLSTTNRDVWTRRCFEIPACGTLMLAPWTADLMNIFQAGSEAAFYDSKQDLLEQVHFYLANPEIRKEVAAAGRVRCERGQHNEIGRASQVIQSITQLRELQTFEH